MTRKDLLRVLSPEGRLLLALAPTGIEGKMSFLEGGGERHESTGDLDWEILYRLLIREQATLALHPIPGRLPAPVPDEWASRFIGVGAVLKVQHQRLLNSLEDALEVLTDRDFPVCLVKGAALAITAYPSPEQRPMVDIDLLVPSGRSDEAWQILRDEGWRWNRERHPLDLYEHRQHAPPLSAPDTAAVVEVHDALLVEGHPFRLSADDLLASAREVPVGASTALVPRSTPHLLYICGHFAWANTLAKGAWRTFRDVAVLTSATEFSWRTFLSMSESANATRACYWTLSLAVELGGVEIPPEVLSSLRPPGLPAPVIRALQRHFAITLFSPREESCPSVALRRELWRLAVQPRSWRENSVVPWEYDAGFVEQGRNQTDKEVGTIGRWRKIIRHLRQSRSWARFFMVLFGRGRRQQRQHFN